MRSNLREHEAMNLNTSPFTCTRFSSLSICLTLRMKLYCVEAFSTLVTLAQPRERSSKLMAPVPEKRSRAVMPSKSTRLLSTLKRFSRAMSVVGRAVMLVGTSKRRLPYFPLMILIVRLSFFVYRSSFIVESRI